MCKAGFVWARVLKPSPTLTRLRTLAYIPLSKEFEEKVGVHQGSVLSPLLFIIVLEDLSREFQAGVP